MAITGVVNFPYSRPEGLEGHEILELGRPPNIEEMNDELRGCQGLDRDILQRRIEELELQNQQLIKENVRLHSELASSDDGCMFGKGKY